VSGSVSGVIDAAASVALPWGEIETVVLDMDGTLLDSYFDDRVWNHALPLRYAERRKIGRVTASSLVRGRLDRARGTLQWYCLDHWTAEFGVDISDLEKELAHLIRVRPGAVSFLQKICRRHCRTILATNAHPGSLARKLERTGIGRYFDVVVSAHELGAPKEDDEFWRSFGSRLRLDQPKVAVIDDNHEVLRAARRFGVRHLRGIRRPSSGSGPVRSREFPCIDSFAAVAPPD
jgi:putative hydrolase of the HAD superfamily